MRKSRTRKKLLLKKQVMRRIKIETKMKRRKMNRKMNTEESMERMDMLIKRMKTKIMRLKMVSSTRT
jgi:hypothetical protein